MADIFGLMKVLGELESIDIDVSESRCVKVRNKNSSCTRCGEACTSGAIRIINNELSVDPELCIGCGTCASVCPTAALEARNPSDKEIADYAGAIIREHGEPLAFACSEFVRTYNNGFNKGRVIKLACLGRLDEAVLLTLIAAGASEILLLCADCQNCSNTTGGHTARTVCSTVDTILAAWNHKSPVILTGELPAELRMDAAEARNTVEPSALSRRDFFAQFKTGAKNLAAGVATNIAEVSTSVAGVAKVATAKQVELTKVMADGTLPHFIPHRREILLDCLSLIGNPVTEWLDTRLWGELLIDSEKCISCQMCATFCPTGAISKYDDPDGSIGIEHYSAHCVQCCLCEDVCSVDALTISSNVELRYFVEGATKRFPMKPLARRINKPDSIYSTMKELLGSGQMTNY